VRVWAPLKRGVLDTTLCDQVCQSLATGRLFSLCTLVSSTNKTDHHDITEILLKVPLNTIKPTKRSLNIWWEDLVSCFKRCVINVTLVSEWFLFNAKWNFFLTIWFLLCIRQHAYLIFYKASSLIQQSAGRHVALLRHINLIQSQSYKTSTWWQLFQKRFMHTKTKLDIVCFYYHNVWRFELVNC